MTASCAPCNTAAAALAQSAGHLPESLHLLQHRPDDKGGGGGRQGLMST
eukprot:CAMPEP_0174366140 /NCGR_PEP_ID=MMETSP0811_2-20130205/80058_1 /TAXON_ID=73025 ORGANISM="Eutreptiella gymnastica-like, Strain CCMP1594" /NCGR_SAMPLE_ID=MMETSP0811_2 /ASSEMBLY_ACC=CAM_ASM_000667 /LENGTH=48 /DNA_ID= /DNA_START= /DNA_END= /DNA_ORIENTATION=